MFCVSSDLNSGKKVRVFSLGGGVFCVSSDLNSGKKVRVFHFPGGGGVLCQIPEQGCSAKIWSKFSGSLAGCCITDSLSHTTYVETNEGFTRVSNESHGNLLVNINSMIIQFVKKSLKIRWHYKVVTQLSEFYFKFHFPTDLRSSNNQKS